MRVWSERPSCVPVCPLAGCNIADSGAHQLVPASNLLTVSAYGGVEVQLPLARRARARCVRAGRSHQPQFGHHTVVLLTHLPDARGPDASAPGLMIRLHLASGHVPSLLIFISVE
jgi:hypothetical protein